MPISEPPLQSDYQPERPCRVSPDTEREIITMPSVHIVNYETARRNNAGGAKLLYVNVSCSAPYPCIWDRAH